VNERNDEANVDDSGVRALRQVVDELRAEPEPQLDWYRVEGALLAKVELDAAARRRARPNPSWGALAAFAAAAAAVVMLLTSGGEKRVDATATDDARRLVDISELRTVAQDPESPPLYLVSSIERRSVIQSGDEPMRFTLPGVVVWTLAPSSRVVVDTVETPHVLTLEEGTVFAEVVPQHRSDQLIESFAVEAGGTRVAVHGTVFSVQRHHDRVSVDVSRGSVTIGPAGYRGATTGHLLVSPAMADFSLHDGKLVAIYPQRPQPAAVAVAKPQPAAANAVPMPGHPPLQPTSVRPWSATAPESAAAAKPASSTGFDGSSPDGSSDGATPAAAATDQPDQPPAANRPLTINEARALVVACLTASTSSPGQPNTVVTISSQVTAMLDATGAVKAVRFSPPLRPDIQQRCGGGLFGRSIQGSGSVSFRVTYAAR